MEMKILFAAHTKTRMARFANAKSPYMVNKTTAKGKRGMRPADSAHPASPICEIWQQALKLAFGTRIPGKNASAEPRDPRRKPLS